MKKINQSILSLTVIFALSIIAFFPIFNSQFVNWDDNFHVTQNLAIRSLDPSHLKMIFTQTVNEIYIPLTTLSYAIEYHFFQLNPYIYHINNFLLHLGVATLLFFFIRKLKFSRFVATIATILFAIHPMHVESVAWVTERKDVMYSFFYILSVFSYYHSLETQKKRYYVIALITGLLSLLAKPMALSLPFILWICDWWYHSKNIKSEWKKLILNKIPFFLYILPITWITYALHSRIPGEGIPSSVLIWIWSFSFYIIKFVYPLNLTPMYSLPEPVSLSNPIYFISLTIFILAIGSVYFNRKNRLYCFAWAFYFFSIFFLLRFDAQADLGIVTDRFMYLPSVGFCLWIAYIFSISFNKTQLKYFYRSLLGGGLILFFLIASYNQSNIWKNSQNLWNHVISINPKIPIAYNNRGMIYEQEGKADLAIKDFDQALQLQPNYLECLCNRGLLTYFHQKNAVKSHQYFTRALLIDPYFAEAHKSRALLFIHEKQYEKAEQSFLSAYNSNPNDLTPLKDLLKLYILTGQKTTALEVIKQKLLKASLSPEKKLINSELAVLYYRREDLDKSFLYMREVFTEDSAENFILLATTFHRYDLSGPALELLNSAILLHPESPDIILLYGQILLDNQKIAAAIAAWEKGKKLHPHNSKFSTKIHSANSLKKPKR